MFLTGKFTGQTQEEINRLEEEKHANKLNNNSSDKKSKNDCALSPEENGVSAPDLEGDGTDTENNEENVNHSCSRTRFLLSLDDRIKRKFPTGTEKHFKSTNHVEAVSDSSPLIGLDCEMVSMESIALGYSSSYWYSSFLFSEHCEWDGDSYLNMWH